MTRVAIIGGGIGGLTAANALSRAGIETAVYEAAAELREIGAGVALHPNAMKVLRAIGVEDGVRKVAGRSQWQVMCNWKTGRVIGRTIETAFLAHIAEDARRAGAKTLAGIFIPTKKNAPASRSSRSRRLQPPARARPHSRR